MYHIWNNITESHKQNVLKKPNLKEKLVVDLLKEYKKIQHKYMAKRDL